MAPMKRKALAAGPASSSSRSKRAKKEDITIHCEASNKRKISVVEYYDKNEAEQTSTKTSRAKRTKTAAPPGTRRQTRGMTKRGEAEPLSTGLEMGPRRKTTKKTESLVVTPRAAKKSEGAGIVETSGQTGSPACVAPSTDITYVEIPPSSIEIPTVSNGNPAILSAASSNGLFVSCHPNEPPVLSPILPDRSISLVRALVSPITTHSLFSPSNTETPHPQALSLRAASPREARPRSPLRIVQRIHSWSSSSSDPGDSKSINREQARRSLAPSASTRDAPVVPEASAIECATYAQQQAVTTLQQPSPSQDYSVRAALISSIDTNAAASAETIETVRQAMLRAQHDLEQIREFERARQMEEDREERERARELEIARQEHAKTLEAEQARRRVERAQQLEQARQRVKENIRRRTEERGRLEAMARKQAEEEAARKAQEEADREAREEAKEVERLLTWLPDYPGSFVAPWGWRYQDKTLLPIETVSSFQLPRVRYSRGTHSCVTPPVEIAARVIAARHNRMSRSQGQAAALAGVEDTMTLPMRQAKSDDGHHTQKAVDLNDLVAPAVNESPEAPPQGAGHQGHVSRTNQRTVAVKGVKTDDELLSFFERSANPSPEDADGDTESLVESLPSISPDPSVPTVPALPSLPDNRSNYDIALANLDDLDDAEESEEEESDSSTEPDVTAEDVLDETMGDIWDTIMDDAVMDAINDSDLENSDDDSEGRVDAFGGTVIEEGSRRTRREHLAGLTRGHRTIEQILAGTSGYAARVGNIIDSEDFDAENGNMESPDMETSNEEKSDVMNSDPEENVVEETSVDSVIVESAVAEPVMPEADMTGATDESTVPG